MVSRAYGGALGEAEIEDVYSAAWAATLSALRVRGPRMSDKELRAYVMTAVASHASKELRRRSRKPAGPIDVAHEQVISDSHAPLPDESAIGSEAANVARDVLTSLPPRRRAVMLLRYGWGLSPSEVCRLVAGLSPRAYRKEVTRGVEELVGRLKQVESGEWCESREVLIRDYVAGTVSEEDRLQLEHHLSHCRACAAFASRLTGQLHDLGGALAASSLGGAAYLPSVLDRTTAAFSSAKEAAAASIERIEATVGGLLTSGAGRLPGAAGTGLAAKLAAGGGGKAVLACLGGGVAATACVAAAVIPATDSRRADEAKTVKVQRTRPAFEGKTAPLVRQAAHGTDWVTETASLAPPAPEHVPRLDSRAPDPPVAEPVTSEPAPPVQPADEFDPVAQVAETAEAPQPAEEPSSPPAASPPPTGPESVAGQEFGP